MPRRVVVTRPQPGASRTAQRLAELGFEPIVLPLTKIVALPVGATVPPETIDAVAATSANALLHAPPALLARLASYRCFAVGSETAAAARGLGFAHVEEGPGDAGLLANTMVRETGKAGTIVYLCGKVRLNAFEGDLIAAGLRIIPFETYDTRPVRYEADRLAATVGMEPVDAVLLYSAMAADLFSVLACSGTKGDLFAGAALLCLSRRIADRLSIGGSRVFVADDPTERQLLRLLEAPGRPS